MRTHMVPSFLICFFISCQLAKFIYLLLGNIRTAIGLSIVAVCFVNETYHKSNFFKDIPLYLIAASFHQAALIMCAARILIVLVDPIIENGKNSGLEFDCTDGNTGFFCSKTTSYIEISKQCYRKSDKLSEQKLLWLFLGTTDRCSEYYSCTCCNAANPKTKIKKQIERKSFWFCALIVLLIVLFGNEFAIFRRLSVLLSIIAIPIIGSFARRGRFMRSEIWWAMLFVPKNTEL